MSTLGEIGGTIAQVALTPGLGAARGAGAGARAAEVAAGAAEAGRAAEAGGALRTARTALTAPWKATVAAPGMAAGRLAEAGAEAMGISTAASSRIARVAQMGAEGAALGASAQMADDELHATPLDAEKIAHSAAVGALWGVGSEIGLQAVGAAAKGIVRAAERPLAWAREKGVTAAERASSFLTGAKRETLEQYGVRAALKKEALNPATSPILRYNEAPKIREAVSKDLTESLDKFHRNLDDVLDQNIRQKEGKIPAMSKLVDKSEGSLNKQRQAAISQANQLETAARTMQADPAKYGSKKTIENLVKRLEMMNEQVLRAKDGGEMFGALDQMKRQLHRMKKSTSIMKTRGGGRDPMAPLQYEAQEQVLESMSESTRQLLMDDAVWGAKAAGAQREINGSWEPFLGNKQTGDPGTQQRFQREFFENLAEDYQTGRMVRRASDKRISSFVNRMGRSENEQAEALLRRQVEMGTKLSDVIEKHYEFTGELGQKAKTVREEAQRIQKILDDHGADLKDWSELDELAAAPKRGLLGAATNIGNFASAGSLWSGGIVNAPAVAAAQIGWRAVADPLATAQQIIAVRQAAREIDTRMGRAVLKMVGTPTKQVREFAPLVAAEFGAAKQAKKQREELQAPTGQRFEPTKAQVEEAMYNVRQFAQMPLQEQIYHASHQVGPLGEKYPRQAAMAAQTMSKQAVYLASQLPQPAPPSQAATLTPMAQEQRTPPISPMQVERFRRQLTAVVDPVSVVEDISDGKLDLEAIEAVKATSPALWQDARQKVAQALSQAENPIDHRRARLLGVAFDLPATPEQVPAIAQGVQPAIQAMTQRDAQNQGPGGGGGPPIPVPQLQTRAQGLEARG